MNVKFPTLAIISKFELIPNTRLVVICLEPLTELLCNYPLADLPCIYRKVNTCNLLLTGVYLDSVHTSHWTDVLKILKNCQNNSAGVCL